MAELLNQYYSFEDLCYSQQHNFSPQQPTAAADRQTRSILHRQIDAIQGQSMSQPLLVSDLTLHFYSANSFEATAVEARW